MRDPASADATGDGGGSRRPVPRAAVIGAVAILLCMAGVIVFGMSTHGAGPGVLGAFIAAAFVAGVFLLLAAASRAQRRRREQLGAACQSLGLDCTLKPDEGARRSAIEPLEHLRTLKSGHKGVKWFAAGTVHGRPVDILEHQYVVSTGKSAHVVIHTIAHTPCPGAWPATTLAPENALHRLGEWLGLRDIRVEDEAFNRRWRVTGESEKFAVVLLSPEVQHWLVGAPRKESWIIGDGRLCLIRHGALKPEEIASAADRLGEFADMVPSELGAWTPADDRA